MLDIIYSFDIFTADIMASQRSAKLIKPNTFKPNNHWVRQAYQHPIDPVVRQFLEMDNSCIITRFCMLHPAVSKENLEKWLSYQPKFFLWAGADLMKVSTKDGHKKIVLIENNSCPSGQKYMPLVNENQSQGGYRSLLERTFKTALNKKSRVQGELAVIYDKNPIETSGYASTMADVFNEDVHYVPAYDNEARPALEFRDGVLYVHGEDNEWHPIRAAFRYVTQRPWNRLPLTSKTLIMNPPIVCLAGGRNKLLASKAYSLFNQELEGSCLAIETPLTVCDVHKNDIANLVKQLGGQAVIKVPYSNAGQGVYIIKNDKELRDFLKEDHPYELFIVQEFIGVYNSKNESMNAKKRLFHIGTIPTEKGSVYVSDIRMMVSATSTGLRPIGMYSRRTATPIISANNDDVTDQTNAFMTNLSFKNPDGTWNLDFDRAMRYDCDGFYRLGLGIDDLIEAFIQTALSTIAIDRMAQALCDEDGQFRDWAFKSLNDDALLLSEIMIA